MPTALLLRSSGTLFFNGPLTRAKAARIIPAIWERLIRGIGLSDCTDTRIRGVFWGFEEAGQSGGLFGG